MSNGIPVAAALTMLLSRANRKLSVDCTRRSLCSTWRNVNKVKKNNDGDLLTASVEKFAWEGAAGRCVDVPCEAGNHVHELREKQLVERREEGGGNGIGEESSRDGSHKERVVYILTFCERNPENLFTWLSVWTTGKVKKYEHYFEYFATILIYSGPEHLQEHESVVVVVTCCWSLWRPTWIQALNTSFVISIPLFDSVYASWAALRALWADQRLFFLGRRWYVKV